MAAPSRRHSPHPPSGAAHGRIFGCALWSLQEDQPECRVAIEVHVAHGHVLLGRPRCSDMRHGRAGSVAISSGGPSLLAQRRSLPADNVVAPLADLVVQPAGRGRSLCGSPSRAIGWQPCLTVVVQGQLVLFAAFNAGVTEAAFCELLHGIEAAFRCHDGAWSTGGATPAHGRAGHKNTRFRLSGYHT